MIGTESCSRSTPRPIRSGSAPGIGCRTWKSRTSRTITGRSWTTMISSSMAASPTTSSRCGTWREAAERMGRSFDHAGRRPKGRPAWALILLVAVWASAARAEDQSQLKISGLVLYENYSYAQRVPGATIDARNELTLRPRVEFSPSQKFDGAASMEFREDASDRGRSKAYLYEAYLNVYFPKWNLTAGRQFIAWGRADTLRPTDLFTRRDYTDLVERREEAIVAVKGDVELGSGMLELVWSPIFEGDILPLAPQNRWFLLPRSLSVASSGPLAAAYQFEDRAEPGNGLESSQVGVRLTGHAGGWDYGLIYAWTLDRIPTYFETRAVQSDLAQGTASVVLVPHHRRLHVFGADFATVDRKSTRLNSSHSS